MFDSELALYLKMYTIRRTEETLLSLIGQGRIAGTVHTCLGQEACAAGVVGVLNPARDIVVSNHRNHGHFLAFTDDVEGLVAEVMGRRTGVGKGVGGSQHLHAKNFFSSGVQGGMMPFALGMALAEKVNATGGVTTVMIGDGTFGEGVVYESMNIAAKWEAPLLIAVEANGFAQSTPTDVQHAGDLSSRASTFGIPSTVVDGNDVLAVHEIAASIVDEVRTTQTPRFLLLNTYRLGPHSKGDDERTAAELEAHSGADPLRRSRDRIAIELEEQVALSERAVDDRIEHAVEAAEHAEPWSYGSFLREATGLGEAVE